VQVQQALEGFFTRFLAHARPMARGLGASDREMTNAGHIAENKNF